MNNDSPKNTENFDWVGQEFPNESPIQRSIRIQAKLKELYPQARTFDLYGDGLHIACITEPAEEHPEYDVCIEIIIKGKPHKHLKMTQKYEVLYGTLILHLNNDSITLHAGDKYSVEPGIVHWPEGLGICACKIRSTPGWTADDHIVV